MSLTNSIIAYYGETLAPSIKYRIESIDPDTMQDLWEGLTDGLGMLDLWLRDVGGDDHDILPDALNRLFDDVFELPTNKSGSQILQFDLMDEFGAAGFGDLLRGIEPQRPVDPQPKVQELWRVAKQIYQANRGVPPTWFRLNALIAAIRNWYHSLPGAHDVSYFDRWLGDAIRHRQPNSPLSWLPATTFLCIYEVDTSEGCVLTDYAPPATVMKHFILTESEETSGLAYLDDEGETEWTNGKHRKWAGELPFWAFDEMMRQWNFGIHDEHGTVMVGIGETYPALSANPYRPQSNHSAAQDMSVTPFPPFDPPKTVEAEMAVWKQLTKELQERYP